MRFLADHARRRGPDCRDRKGPGRRNGVQDATKKKVSVTVFQNGQPLPGAIVLISGSNVGTVTGKEGTAQISAAPGNELVISYVGCQTRKIRVSDKSGAESFEITLETESNKLDPVSVTPATKKRPRPKAPQEPKRSGKPNRSISSTASSGRASTTSPPIRSNGSASSKISPPPQCTVRGVKTA